MTKEVIKEVTKDVPQNGNKVSMKKNERQASFNYKNKTESVDAIFNYLSMVSKGLKKRTITLSQEQSELELHLPEDVKFKIKAKVHRESSPKKVKKKSMETSLKKSMKNHGAPSKRSSRLSFSLEWDEPNSSSQP